MKIKRYAIVLLALILSLALFGCKETTTEAPTITEQPTTVSEVITTAAPETSEVTEAPTTEIPTEATTTSGTDLLLYISEYGEGSSYNKWIELYNPNDVEVSLAGYEINLYSNEHTDVTGTLVFTTETIPANSTYIIANPSANETILSLADKTDSDAINFNGDDAVTLVYNSVIVDIIGTIDSDYTKGVWWTVGDTANATVNHTIVRVASVNSGNTTFTGSEWTVLDVDSTSSLGQR